MGKRGRKPKFGEPTTPVRVPVSRLESFREWLEHPPSPMETMVKQNLRRMREDNPQITVKTADGKVTAVGPVYDIEIIGE